MCVLHVTGTAQEFKRKFETPIMRGRDAAATDDEHLRGEQKLQEVNMSFFSPSVFLFPQCVYNPNPVSSVNDTSV